MRSYEQKRSKFAYKCVKEVKEYEHSNNKEIQQKYNSYASRAPVLILTNGLGNTLAFYQSKIGDSKKPQQIAYKLLYEHINKWLKENYTNGIEIMNWFLDEKTTTLDVAYATEEALRFLNWIKRFSDAMLEKEA